MHRVFSALIIVALFLSLDSGVHAQDAYGSSESKFHVSAEGGVGILDTGPEGQFPNSEFRADEGKVFLEGQISENIFVFGEVNLITREEPDDRLELGELYVQFENIRGRLLNARAGRFDIPFGEEYLTRDAIDNPFVSHSLSDFWGVDEGVEIYGSSKNVDYVFAVQNGAGSIIHDRTADKSVSGRVAYKVRSGLHFSFSAMRTGDIDAQNDRYAALWFGNLPVSVIDGRSTVFHANAFRGDGHLSWNGGHVQAGAGELRHAENNAYDSDQRKARFFQLEGIQDIARNKEQILYGGIRFSRINSDRGFPVAGNGDPDLYHYSYSALTETIWRLSFGVGYRISRNALLKTEYNFERGKLINGYQRDHEDFWGAEAAFRF